MNKIKIATVILFITALGASEGYQVRKHYCQKAYVDTSSHCMVLGPQMCRYSVEQNWPKIRHYCPDTIPAYYKEFHTAMKKMGKI